MEGRLQVARSSPAPLSLGQASTRLWTALFLKLLADSEHTCVHTWSSITQAGRWGLRGQLPGPGSSLSPASPGQQPPAAMLPQGPLQTLQEPTRQPQA